MTQPSWSSGGGLERPQSAGLADVLELVLDKGVVIAGDIKINLLEIELLTIKLRLLIASVDKAKEMGIDWWEDDPMLSSSSGRDRESGGDTKELARRLDAVERRLGAGSSEDGQ
jgi:hypothetical protein